MRISRISALMLSTAMLAACTTMDGSADLASADGIPSDSARDTPPTVADGIPADSAKDGPVPGEQANAEIAPFFERYDEANLASSPISKSYRGIRDEDYGKWDDPSEAQAKADFARGQNYLAEMQARFDPAALSASNALSYRLFRYQRERAAGAFEFRDNHYVFDQMNGAQAQLPAFLINIHSVDNEEQATAYVERLEGIGPFIEELVGIAADRANGGVAPPDWVYPYVIDDAKNVISGGPFDQGKDSPLFADLKEKVNALDIPETRKAALIARGSTALTDSLAPAYRTLIAEMERQMAITPEGDGVWRLPDGASYYAERLKNYTTTDLSADQIHQIGLDNVARIHNEMRAIMAQLGFKGTLQEFFAKVRTDGDLFFDTREGYLAAAQAKLDAMQQALPGFFNTLPKAELRVKAVEEFREKSAGKAFYNRPAPDGSRPGTYYVNLYNLNDMSKTELEALAYHEGLPGHHLQLSIQTELEGLPPFRRFGGVTAYTEGWGLYSEELGKDMGFYTDPYSDFGRLGMELWRACRLVVDTGIHDKRWNREEAIQYLKDNTPNPDGDIRKAIERYIVFPGQATAYMIGKLKILELRDRAQAALGDEFDYGDFHQVILESGPVPLTVMEERVDAWLAQQNGL